MTQQARGHAISMEDVFVRYPSPGGGTKTVLSDVDLKVSPGELITVVGPTGCGKSTLLKLILGSERPTSGTVMINGVVSGDPDRHRGIVFQKYSLFSFMTVADNIQFGLELEGFNLVTRGGGRFFYKNRLKAYKDEAMVYLKRIGLDDSDANKYPHQLSGGMRQRVAIAQAMIIKPSVLLMDEPFGALDDATRQSMQLFLLEQWAKSKMTIFFVTHSLEEALFLGTRLIVISPHYKADTKCEGSKIVIDKAVPEVHNPDFKHTPVFNGMLAQIRTNGLNPDNPLHISQFDLSHPDACRTVTQEEWRRE